MTSNSEGSSGEDYFDEDGYDESFYEGEEESDPISRSSSRLAIIFIIVSATILFSLVIFGFVTGILTIILAQKDNDPYFGSRVIFSTLPCILGLLSVVCFVITERILFKSKNVAKIDLPLGLSFVFAYFTVWSGTASVYVWISFLFNEGKHGGYEFMPLVQLGGVMFVLAFHIIYTKIRMRHSIKIEYFPNLCNLSHYFASVSFVIFSVLGLTLWPTTLKNYDSTNEQGNEHHQFVVMSKSRYSLISNIAIPIYLISSVLISFRRSEFFTLILSIFWSVIITVLCPIGYFIELHVEPIFFAYIFFNSIIVHFFQGHRRSSMYSNALSTIVFCSLATHVLYITTSHSYSTSTSVFFGGSLSYQDLFVSFVLLFISCYIPAFLVGKAFFWPVVYPVCMVWSTSVLSHNPVFLVINFCMVAYVYTHLDTNVYCESHPNRREIKMIFHNGVYFCLCLYFLFEYFSFDHEEKWNRYYFVIIGIVLFVGSLVFDLGRSRIVFPILRWSKREGKLKLRKFTSWKSLFISSWKKKRQHNFDFSFYWINMIIFVISFMTVPFLWKNGGFTITHTTISKDGEKWYDVFPFVSVGLLLLGLLISNVVSQIPIIIITKIFSKNKVESRRLFSCFRIEVLHFVIIVCITIQSLPLVLTTYDYVFAIIVFISYLFSFRLKWESFSTDGIGLFDTRIRIFRPSVFGTVIGCVVLVIYTSSSHYVYFPIIVLLSEINASSMKSRMRTFFWSSLILILFLFYKDLFSQSNTNTSYFSWLFEREKYAHFIWDSRIIAFVIMGLIGSFISFDVLLKKIVRSRNYEDSSSSIIRNPFLRTYDYVIFCFIMFLFSLLSSPFFVSHAFCLLCIVLVSLFLYIPQKKKNESTKHICISLIPFIFTLRIFTYIVFTIFALFRYSVDYSGKRKDIDIDTLVEEEKRKDDSKFLWFTSLSVGMSVGLGLWIAFLSIPFCLKRLQLYGGRMKINTFIAGKLSQDNKQNSSASSCVLVEISRSLSVLGVIFGLICSTWLMWPGLLASFVYVFFIVIPFRGDYLFLHFFPFIVFILRQFMVIFWAFEKSLDKLNGIENTDDMKIVVFREVCWSILPYLIPYLLLRFTNVFEFSSNQRINFENVNGDLSRKKTTLLNILHLILTRLYFVMILFAAFVSSAMFRELYGVPAFVATAVVIIRAFIGFSLADYVMSSIYITLQLSYLVVYFPNWGYFPVQICNFIVSFIALTYFKIQAKEGPSNQKLLSKHERGILTLIKFGKNFSRIYVTFVRVFATFVVFSVPFTFMFVEANGVRLYFVFQVLFQMLGLWFSMFLGSYFALFFYPLATSLFVFLQLLESSSNTLPWDDCLARGLTAGWIHSYVMYLLSQFGLIYILSSRRARKLLFLPLEKFLGVFFFKGPIGGTQRKIENLLKGFGPSTIYRIFYPPKKTEESETVQSINSDEEDVSAKVVTYENFAFNYSTWGEYFADFTSELKHNMMRSTKQPYFKNLTFFLLLQHSVLSFVSYSYGCCSIISFFTCISFFCYHRILMWVLFAPVVFSSAILISFLRTHALSSDWGSEGQFFMFIPTGSALVLSSSSVYAVVMSVVGYYYRIRRSTVISDSKDMKEELGDKSVEDGTNDQSSSKISIEDTSGSKFEDSSDVSLEEGGIEVTTTEIASSKEEEDSSTTETTNMNDMASTCTEEEEDISYDQEDTTEISEVSTDKVMEEEDSADNLEQLKKTKDGKYDIMVFEDLDHLASLLNTRKHEKLKQLDFVERFRCRFMTDNFLDSFRFQSWFFWFQSLYFTYFTIGCLFISLPLIHYSTLLIVILSVAIGTFELVLSCFEGGRNHRWRRAVGFGRILVGLLACTFVLPVPEDKYEIVSEETFWITFGVSLVVACVYGIFVSVLYIYWLMIYLRQRQHQQALVDKYRKSKKTFVQRRPPNFPQLQNRQSTEYEYSSDLKDSSTNEEEEEEEEMRKIRRRKREETRSRKRKLDEMARENPDLFKMIVDEWGERPSELFELISDHASSSSSFASVSGHSSIQSETSDD